MTRKGKSAEFSAETEPGVVDEEFDGKAISRDLFGKDVARLEKRDQPEWQLQRPGWSVAIRRRMLRVFLGSGRRELDCNGDARVRAQKPFPIRGMRQ